MWWLPPVALILDLLLADPKRLPHPVGAIALLARKLEAPARSMRHPVLAGGLVLGILLLIAGSVCAALVRLPSLLGVAAALYLSWAGLALGGLLREGEAALAKVAEAERLRAAGNGDSMRALEEARAAVRMLVSRDTGAMHPQDLCRSLAESISENFNDAFVAPFFWLCLGGPVGLWLYKTASTMDSLWGYKNERWLYLGRASARLDDALAYIPARVSVLLMYAAARPGKKARGADGAATPGWPGLRTVMRQAGLCDSPNSGWPMAAAAWLFHGRSGGPTPYDGKMADKPFLGPEQGKWTPHNTARLLKHVWRAGMLGGLAGTAISWFFHQI